MFSRFPSPTPPPPDTPPCALGEKVRDLSENILACNAVVPVMGCKLFGKSFWNHKWSNDQIHSKNKPLKYPSYIYWIFLAYCKPGWCGLYGTCSVAVAQMIWGPCRQPAAFATPSSEGHSYRFIISNFCRHLIDMFLTGKSLFYK